MNTMWTTMKQLGFSLGTSMIAVAIIAFVGYVHNLQAQSSDSELQGYAWSSNIGWINFDCESTPGCNPATQDFGVTMNASTGELSGYAWSSNIGWIRFDPADDGYGRLEATINTATGQVIGWARACSVFPDGNTPRCEGDMKDDSERGGWDGWIEMSGTNHSSPNTSDTTPADGHGDGGVTYQAAGERLIGYAWGGEVLGWIDFCDMDNENNYCVKVVAPVTIPVTLSPDPIALDLDAAGNAQIDMIATIGPDSEGNGSFTFEYYCGEDGVSDDQDGGSPPPFPATTQEFEIPFTCYYTATSRGQRTIRIDVHRNGTGGGSDTATVVVKPKKPTFKEK